MAGTMANVDLAKTATDPHRWRDLEMDLKGIIEPQPGVVILTYNAKAVRATDEVSRPGDKDPSARCSTLP